MAKVSGYVKNIAVDVGDHVRIELVDADVERGFIDFRASG